MTLNYSLLLYEPYYANANHVNFRRGKLNGHVTFYPIIITKL